MGLPCLVLTDVILKVAKFYSSIGAISNLRTLEILTGLGSGFDSIVFG
jgi:hypothetical protein